eukprot:m.192665 g.192665  ORF g.192665 m.192665 type:complete len:512 (-) comp18715_c0_seq1:58-1593(-)
MANERQPLLLSNLSADEIAASASYYHQYASAADMGGVDSDVKNSETIDVSGGAYPKIHPDGDPNRKASLWTAIFHTWNATIGVGILALPRAFALVGWATGSASLLAFSLLCLTTFAMLAAAMRSTNEFTYGGVMLATVGPVVAEATDCIIFLFLFGVLVVYAQTVAAIVVDLLAAWNALPLGRTVGTWLDDRRLFVLVIGLGAFWPLSLFPKLYFLKYVSLFSTMAITYVVVVVIVRLFEEVDSNAPDAPCVLPGLNLDGTCAEAVRRDATFTDYASAISAFSFALTTHTSLPPIVSELDRPTSKRIKILINALVWFSFTLYLITGIAGYLLFGSRQCPLVSNAFSRDDRLMQAGQLAVVLSVTGGHPVQTFQARVSFDRLFRVERWLFPHDGGLKDDSVCCGLLTRDTARSMLSATVIVWSSVAIAFFVGDIDAVIDLTGAVGGGVTAFVLPCLAYARIGPEGSSTVLRWVYVAFGFALVLFLTGVVIYGIATFEVADEDIGTQTCGRNP